jgi:hypothetical protein
MKVSVLPKWPSVGDHIRSLWSTPEARFDHGYAGRRMLRGWAIDALAEAFFVSVLAECEWRRNERTADYAERGTRGSSRFRRSSGNAASSTAHGCEHPVQTTVTTV